MSQEFSSTESWILGFWVLCLIFSWSHRYGHTPDLFREHHGTQTWKTRNQMSIVPTMILTLIWQLPSISPVIQTIQTQLRLLMWWACVCRSNFVSCTNKSPFSTIILPRGSSIPFKSVCEVSPLEAVIRRPSILYRKCLWSGSNTLPSTLRSEGALADFTADYTRRITKFSNAVSTESWTLVLTNVITLCSSLRTFVTIFFSSVFTSTSG